MLKFDQKKKQMNIKIYYRDKTQYCFKEFEKNLKEI